MTSVTGRVKETKQPYGGFLNPSIFSAAFIQDGIKLNSSENINASIVGMTVDYLTRFQLTGDASNAFRISLMGASNLRVDVNSLLNNIKGLDDESIICACKLAGFDVAYRSNPQFYKEIPTADPDTIFNIRTMVTRSENALKNSGEILDVGFSFPGAYTNKISVGDADYLTSTTLWDLKTSKHKFNSSDTLQLLIYYLMGLHCTNHHSFNTLKRIGFINPRIGTIHHVDISDISSSIQKDISNTIIGYAKNTFETNKQSSIRELELLHSSDDPLKAESEKKQVQRLLEQSDIIEDMFDSVDRLGDSDIDGLSLRKNEEISKPDKRLVQRVLDEAEIVQEAFLSVKGRHQELIRKVQKETERLLESQILEKMETISIDRLSTTGSGIKLTALKSYGYRTIKDVFGVSYNSLLKIPGVGEKTAEKTITGVKVIYGQLRVNTPIKILLDEKDENIRTFIESIYLINKGSIINRNINLLFPHHQQVLEETNKFRFLLKNKIRWFFSFQLTKDKAVRTFEKLKVLLTMDYVNNAFKLEHDYNQLYSSSHSDSWTLYSTNSAGLYSTIENLMMDYEALPISASLNPNYEKNIFFNLENPKYIKNRFNNQKNTKYEKDIFSKQLNQKHEEDMLELKKFSVSQGWKPKDGLLDSKFTLSSNKNTGNLTRELVEQISSLNLNIDNLKVDLRPYQIFGTQFILNQGNSMLGDEMGLGKTIQAIAAMAHLKAAGESVFLVVCPASVLINWTREVEKHSSLETIQLHGPSRELQLENWAKRGGIAITTYQTLNKLEIPKNISISLMIADEAHYVKNPAAKRTKSILKVMAQSKRVCFMTGTPLENSLVDMISLLSFLVPKLGFSDMFLERRSKDWFRIKIAPIYLRRKREDVLKELPELIEIEDWLLMNATETIAYKQLLEENNFMSIRCLSWNVKEITNSGKAQKLIEIVNDATANGRKILIFSFFRKTIDTVCSIFDKQFFGPITGDVSPTIRQEIVDKFNQAPAGTVLISQVTAGGTGLNIQGASVVVFCEPQLKPSTEQQAISRAYRMGQNQNVIVHRLLVKDSLDESIMEKLKFKQKEFDDYADKSDLQKYSIEKTWSEDAIKAQQKLYGIVPTLKESPQLIL